MAPKKLACFAATPFSHPILSLVHCMSDIPTDFVLLIESSEFAFKSRVILRCIQCHLVDMTLDAPKNGFVSVLVLDHTAPWDKVSYVTKFASAEQCPRIRHRLHCISPSSTKLLHTLDEIRAECISSAKSHQEMERKREEKRREEESLFSLVFLLHPASLRLAFAAVF